MLFKSIMKWCIKFCDMVSIGEMPTLLGSDVRFIERSFDSVKSYAMKAFNHLLSLSFTEFGISPLLALSCFVAIVQTLYRYVVSCGSKAQRKSKFVAMADESISGLETTASFDRRQGVFFGRKLQE